MTSLFPLLIAIAAGAPPTQPQPATSSDGAAAEDNQAAPSSELGADGKNTKDAPAEADASPAIVESRKEDPIELVRLERQAMGTDVKILIYAENKIAAERAAVAAVREIERIEQLMSEWLPESEISRINQNAGANPVPVSKETRRLLELGLRVFDRSKGAFAMTWASLGGLWNFQPAEGELASVPSAAAIAERLPLVDDRKLQLTKAGAKLETSGMALGLGGIAKGFATDRALAVLDKAGFPNALVFIGGDVAVRGKKGRKPWVVGLQEPRAAGYFAVLTLDEEAVATSGDYESYIEVDGERYHHILDPRTGAPARGLRSVTVVSKNAAKADAYATAIFVLGPVKGLELAEAVSDIEAVLVDDGSNVIVSQGLADRLRILHQPER